MCYCNIIKLIQAGADGTDRGLSWYDKKSDDTWAISTLCDHVEFIMSDQSGNDGDDNDDPAPESH